MSQNVELFHRILVTKLDHRLAYHRVSRRNIAWTDKQNRLYKPRKVEDRDGLLFFRHLGARFRAYLGSRNAFLFQAKHEFWRMKPIMFDKLVITTDLD